MIRSVAFIQQRFGIDITKPQWSSYKSQMKAREAKQAGQSGAVWVRATESSKLPLPSGNGDLLLAVEVLIDQHGIDQALRIVRLFA